MKSYIVALLLVVGVLAGFYGGYKVGQNNVSASTTQNSSSKTGANLSGGGGFTGGRGGGGGFGSACPSPGAPSPSPGSNAVASGTVTDLTSNSLTITTAACDVKVTFDNTVQVSKTVTGTTSDLRDTATITIVGTRQADGSIKATQIQIGARIVIRAGASPSPAGG